MNMEFRIGHEYWDSKIFFNFDTYSSNYTKQAEKNEPDKNKPRTENPPFFRSFLFYHPIRDWCSIPHFRRANMLWRLPNKSFFEACVFFYCLCQQNSYK